MLDDSNNLEIDFSSRNTSQRDTNNSSVSATSSRYHKECEHLTRCVELISIHNALGKNRSDPFQKLLPFTPFSSPTLIQDAGDSQSRSK